MHRPRTGSGCHAGAGTSARARQPSNSPWASPRRSAVARPCSSTSPKPASSGKVRTLTEDPVLSEELTIISELRPGDSCAQFSDDRTACESTTFDDGYPLSFSMEGGVCNFDGRKDVCIWDALETDLAKKCKNAIIPISGGELGRCIYEFTGKATECDEVGKSKIGVSTTFQSLDPACTGDCVVCGADGQCEIPCGRSVASLPFFGALQLIIAFVIVGIIYYAIVRTKKKRQANILLGVANEE